MAQVTQDELKKVLLEDVKDGETDIIEFKDYPFGELGDNGKGNKHRDELADEIAALAGEKGGRIYLGVTKQNKVIGCEGSYEEWEKLLIIRATGKVTPSVSINYEIIKIDSTQFPDCKFNTIFRLDVPKGFEPIYYRDSKPVIRYGTNSRTAKPEEVKEKFLRFIKEHGLESLIHSDAKEKEELLVSILRIFLRVQVALNQYQEIYKQVKPQIYTQDGYLQAAMDEIEEKIFTIEQKLGKDSPYYINFQELSKQIYDFINDPFKTLSGGKQRDEFMSEIEVSANKVYEELKKESLLEKKHLEKQLIELKSKTLRWLNKADRFMMKPFRTESNNYYPEFISLYWQFKLIDSEPSERLKIIKDIADNIEQVSWEHIPDHRRPEDIVFETKELLSKL